MSLNELAAAACALRDALRNRGVLLNDHIESEPKQIADHHLSIAVARMRAALAATLRKEASGLNEQVRIAIDRLSRIVSADHFGAGADFRKMESDAGTAVRVLIKAGANVAVPDASQAGSIAEDVPQTMPLSVVVQTCGESLSAYVALRAELFRSLVASRSLGGGPWRIQFTRDQASGVALLHPRVDYHVGEHTGLPDHPSKVMAVFKKVETFAPCRDFCFVNASGGRPEEGSEARVAELRMQFLLGELLHTVMVLTACLETLELGAQELGLTTDTSPLTRLATALPAFPYWPEVSRNQAFYDEVLATEGVLVENARVTLRMLINEQTSREMLATMEHSKTAPGSRRVPSDLISQSAAAGIVGCSDSTIRRRIDDGVLRGFGPKGARRVSADDLERNRLRVLERKARTTKNSRKRQRKTPSEQ